jgi:hypothetical protein
MLEEAQHSVPFRHILTQYNPGPVTVSEGEFVPTTISTVDDICEYQVKSYKIDVAAILFI